MISGKSHGQESPVRPLGGCWYFHVKFKNPGKFFQDLRQYPISRDINLDLTPPLAAGWTSFIYSKSLPVLSGI